MEKNKQEAALKSQEEALKQKEEMEKRQLELERKKQEMEERKKIKEEEAALKREEAALKREEENFDDDDDVTGDTRNKKNRTNRKRGKPKKNISYHDNENNSYRSPLGEPSNNRLKTLEDLSALPEFERNNFENFTDPLKEILDRSQYAFKIANDYLDERITIPSIKGGKGKDNSEKNLYEQEFQYQYRVFMYDLFAKCQHICFNSISKYFVELLTNYSYLQYIWEQLITDELREIKIVNKQNIESKIFVDLEIYLKLFCIDLNKYQNIKNLIYDQNTTGFMTETQYNTFSNDHNLIFGQLDKSEQDSDYIFIYTILYFLNKIENIDIFLVYDLLKELVLLFVEIHQNIRIILLINEQLNKQYDTILKHYIEFKERVNLKTECWIENIRPQKDGTPGQKTKKFTIDNDHREMKHGKHFLIVTDNSTNESKKYNYIFTVDQYFDHFKTNKEICNKLIGDVEKKKKKNS